MTGHFARTDLRVDMKNVRSIVQIDLLKHAFNRPVALFVNSKRSFDFGSNFLRKIQTIIVEKQSHVGDGSANWPGKSANVLQKVRIQAGQVVAIF